ncbi:unnamed protein product [Phytophthora lilii]|uniref:Unnamed protein product n=1 Tax=Phytophthora lilii TaxID=2077276 RepID=A0A9W6TDJ2_9STRA|nr:unnamed protein product [Phytophthora lilii]
MEEDNPLKWDFLLPWCKVISPRLWYVKGALDDAPGQHFRGIQVELPSFKSSESAKRPCQDLREALALVAALAHVDNAAWKKLLVEDIGLNVGVQEELFEGDFMPRFQLVRERTGDGPDDDGELLTGIREFCGTQQYTEQSKEYKEALAKIASMSGGRPCTGSTEIEIPVIVKLEPWLTISSGNTLAYFQKVHETIKTVRMDWQQQLDQKQVPLSIAFVLESIMADLRDVSITAELAELVESLAADGIRMSGMALRHELCQELIANESLDDARKTIGRLSFSLFGGAKQVESFAGEAWGGFNLEVTSITGPLASELGYTKQLALSSVHFDCEAAQNWVFERICSAVAVNQTTKHLSLSLEMNDGDWGLSCWRWKWIGFACFSEKARLHSKLESLRLRNAVITAEAVEAMATMLGSEGPEETLLGCTIFPTDASVDVCIRANSRIKVASMQLDEILDDCQSFMLDREIAGVKLLDENYRRDRVDVLVPGFGKCQVQRSSLVYRELPLPPNGLAGVTSLAIKFGEDPDPQNLQGLLILIGASITHLTLGFTDFITGELEGIVSSCPKLVELAVCTHTIEVRFCLRDNNHRDLVLDSACNFSFRSVERIAEVLCDSENPFTKCARRLRVRMDQTAVFHPFNDCYAALLKMLETNRSLEYLDVVGQRSHMAHYNDFKAHHHEPLPVARVGFPMDCKAALLSVMEAGYGAFVGSKRRKSSSPLPALDQHVLVSIFEYAAPHVDRQVYFREYNFFETGRYYMPI